MNLKNHKMKTPLKALFTTAALYLILGIGAAEGVDSKDDLSNGDLAKLNGTWVSELNGKTTIFHFNQGKFAEIIEFPDGITTTSGTIAIDSTEVPKHMDWNFAVGTGRGVRLAGTTGLTIYELDGDVFKFCAKKSARPTNFPNKEGAFPDKDGIDEYIYLVFKRAKY